MEPSLPRVFSSLQYTEDEIKPAKVDFSNPEIQDYLKECTITPAQLEWFQSRDYALAKLLWGKFTAKIEVRLLSFFCHSPAPWGRQTFELAVSSGRVA